MSNLRAAAERVIRSSGGDESLFSIYCTTLATDALRKHAADCGALAEHILASHPPDGETEIDEAWLLRVGFNRSYDGIYEIVFQDAISEESSLEWHCDGKAFIASELTVHCKTRSDLRGLCAALGISLKEPSTQGA